ncbi:MAG: class I SAM-dependent methyltransferase [Nitrospirae bacterium]|nr:class I SAM-dependent methyltransferase [Nitrospirota bacterium]
MQMVRLMKSLRLLSLLPRNPREFYDRVSSIAEARWAARDERPSYSVHAEQSALHLLAGALGTDVTLLSCEARLVEIEAQVQRGKEQIPADAPFGAFHNSDYSLARFCYQLVRALQPRVIVETGVCYGVTSAYVLQALEVNGKGCLHSIDLPPLGKDASKHIGRLVPAPLRSRWTLHRGTTKRLLPPLLAELREIDMFIHDSLHTCRNMRFEFGAAWPALRPGGVLVSDDVEGNVAFQDLSALPDVALSVVIKEQSKESLFGVAVKRA